MTFPTIHMNGTSAQDLLEGYCEAINALCNAMEVMAKASPHGRDYYVQGPGATQAAIEEHGARLLKVTNVMRELEALAEAVAKEVR